MTKPLQFKVSLQGIEPEIWRRIVVPDFLNLLELHAVLQGAMGWQDSHSHMFDIDGQKYEVPETDEFGSEEGYLDERKITLKKALKNISEFNYTYDFGDNWQHSIVMENAVPIIPQRLHGPFCLAGENACPPEDCGGAYDYPSFVAALVDTDHPEHLAMKNWTGAFDSGEFSAHQATVLIQVNCAFYRERGIGLTN